MTLMVPVMYGSKFVRLNIGDLENFLKNFPSFDIASPIAFE